MPSHQERVRRNYHTIVLREAADPPTGDMLIQIRVTKAEIASCMRTDEIERTVLRAVQRGIRGQWRYP